MSRGFRLMSIRLSVRRDVLDRAWRADRLTCNDGTVAIEFAIVGLLFFTLLLGSIEMGRAMWMRNSVQFAAEETARWAIVNPGKTPEAIEIFAEERSIISSPPAKATATFEPPIAGVTYLLVEVKQSFIPVTSLVRIKEITMIGRARIAVNKPP
jgi:hypothetical protein